MLTDSTFSLAFINVDLRVVSPVFEIFQQPPVYSDIGIKEGCVSFGRCFIEE